MVSTILMHFSAGLGTTSKFIQGLFSLKKLATKTQISENCSGLCLGFFLVTNLFVHWK